MTQLLSPKLKRWLTSNDSREGVTYWCQGCESIHQVVTRGPGAWGYNGNPDKPTFTPSVLVHYDYGPPEARVHKVCHTFITDGMVQFLGDCTHALAGKTEPLPDLPEQWRTIV